MNARTLALNALNQSRQARLTDTAKRNAATAPQLSGTYGGHDCKTGENLIKLPNGNTIRARAINTAAPPSGVTIPVRIAPSGRPISDGRHSAG
jgi:hypothetical protein